MAVRARSGMLHFLVSVLLITTEVHDVRGIEEWILGCGNQIDLMTNQRSSGLIKVEMPSSFAQYQDPQIENYCDITINFSPDLNLLLELYYVDIVPLSNEDGCTTGLEVLELPTHKNLYGSRLCSEAWEWEQKHRESRQEKRVVQSSPLTFRLTSSGPYRGNGFKAHFNEFRPAIPCYTREFRCQEFQRCVHDDLTCDGWDDCGDDTDEKEDAGCNLLTASEICAIIIGILLLIGTVAISLVFFISYRRLSRDYAMKSESKLPIADDLKSIPDTVISFPRRYNSQESMNKSAYSRNTGNRRDSDADSIDKIELEKAERYSYKPPDSVSERSYRSNQKKNRPPSQTADEKRYSNHKNASLQGSSNPALTNGHSDRNRDGQRDLDRSFDSDHGIPDRERSSRDRSRDRYYRDRERSRDRRDRRDENEDSTDRDSIDRDRDRRYRDRDSRYRRDDRDRYSDENSDREPRSYDNRDYGRRRSKERSRDRYSDDDSEDEHYRRRRRRSYDRYSDEDSESERERERRRRRRSRDRQSRERVDYADKGDPDERERNKDDNYDRDSNRERRRKSSRDRERDRPRDYYDDDRDRGKYVDDVDKEDRRRRRSAERRPYRDDAEDPRRREPSAERDRPQEKPTRSREHLVRQDSPPPPPRGEDIRRWEQEKARPAKDPNPEPVRSYTRRSMEERRGRRRSRGRPVTNDSPPPVYEDVNVGQNPGIAINVAYKEAAV